MRSSRDRTGGHGLHRELRKLGSERMRGQAEAMIVALRRGLIDAADFSSARRRLGP